MRISIKIITIVLTIFTATLNDLKAQEWMNSLEVAKKLALTQNKMLFVMWEASIEYELPVIVTANNGETYYVEDLLLSEELNAIIWDLFVPVLLNETAYDTMYEEIKDKRSNGYLELFRDDTIKIMDVNSNILNTAYVNYNYFEFRKFVEKYALDTRMLAQEYRNYRREKDFYTTFYLGSKYVDFAIYSRNDIRAEIIELSNIYLDEADKFLENMEMEDKHDLEIRCELVRIKQDLVLNNSRKVIRRLNKIDREELSEPNKRLMGFLYFTAFRLEGDVENTKKWREGLSLVNLKEANYIYENIKE